MERPEAQKSSHLLVQYTDHAKDKAERCAACRHFIRPDRCETVKSPISPAGWCIRFEAKHES
jgi:hypothetical protein